MTYGIFYKVSKQMVEDMDFMIIMAKNQVNIRRKELARKSLILKDLVTTIFDQDGDNFRRNLVTVQILGKAYKVPRILKSRYKNTFDQ